MADQEEDFSSLPLPDRFVHKNWKVRKEAYEQAAKEFDQAQTESDPIVRTFITESGLWKGAVGDSNVAAQQEGLGALCSFLQIAGTTGCVRTRGSTIAPIVEKGLAATRPAAKQKALEAILLYIELDKPDPVIEELLPFLSHKQPKIIAATLTALREVYHAYGCRTVEPKPVLKALPKVFGHADKNVRAEAQNMTVELYRWLKDAMKPLFWEELKPVQQQDLEKLFEKVKGEPAPKQERLLKSQQATVEARGGGAGGDEEVEEGGEEEDAAIDLEPEYVAVDVFATIPKDLQERLGSSKWKDRKEALDELFTVVNVPKIAEGQFHEIMAALAKCMKDANIAVVSSAANCVEAIAKGLKKSFGKYRSVVVSPMLERLKEKKQSVTDAIGAALDAVLASTSLGDNLEEIQEFLKHKNPQVKLETTRFLIRSLKTIREAPQPPEVKSIADAATKLLTESQEVQRSAGAEVLGTLWKIMGDRMMAPHLEGLDDIRKNKIKDFYEAAEVKAKYKPKAAAPPKPAAAPAPKKTLGKKPPGATVKKAPPPKAASPPPPVEDPAPAPLAPRPTSRPGVTKLGGAPKSGLAPPTGGLKLPQKKTLAGPSALASPRRQVASAPPPEDPPAALVPKLGLGRGLVGKSLGKPTPASTFEPPAPSPPAGLSAIERAEMEELRAEIEAMRKQNEDLRADRTKLKSQIHELQNQNAQLIEDHTRDVLSIKAKETQLVRARSDHEASEQVVQTQQREIERLKRELSRQVRAASPASLDASGQIYNDTGMNGTSRYDSGFGGAYNRDRSRGGERERDRDRGYISSPTSEGKENVNLDGGAYPSLESRKKLSQPSYGAGIGSGGRSTPTAGMRSNSGLSVTSGDGESERPGASRSTSGVNGNKEGVESWKRAAEVTQNLKARIEQMKARQGLMRQ